MSIFVDENTKVIYQGLTGSQGRFYGLRNRDYGTKVVGGTNPKKAGENVDVHLLKTKLYVTVHARGPRARDRKKDEQQLHEVGPLGLTQPVR